MDHADVVEAVQNELSSECREQEAEYLLGHEHPALVEVVAHTFGQAKDEGVED